MSCHPPWGHTDITDHKKSWKWEPLKCISSYLKIHFQKTAPNKDLILSAAQDVFSYDSVWYDFWSRSNDCSSKLISLILYYTRTSFVAQLVKNPLAVQETWVWFLGWEDPLEKEMATHSSVLAWRIPWTEEPGGLQSMRWQRVGHNWVTNTQKLYTILGIYQK